MTVIDPARARGLAQRFVRESATRGEETIAQLDGWRIGKKRDYYESQLAGVDTSTCLSTYLGGSNKRPYLFLSHFWDEGGTRAGGAGFAAVHIRFFEFRQGVERGGGALGFTVSMHVIERLYQRLPLPKLSGEDVCHQDIVAEFRYCELSAVFWRFLLTRVDLSEEERNNLHLPIPAHDGIFVARWDKARGGDGDDLGIRTFVDMAKLSPGQRAFRDTMIGTLDLFRDSLVRYALPVCEGVVTEVDAVDVSFLVALFFHHAERHVSKAMSYEIYWGDRQQGRAGILEKYRFGEKIQGALAELARQDVNLGAFLDMYANKGERHTLAHLRKLGSNALNPREERELDEYLAKS